MTLLKDTQLLPQVLQLCLFSLSKSPLRLSVL